MSHTYATVDEFKSFITDGGANYGTTNDDRLLTVLEASSRAVDAFVERSSFGSGFGPRTATNRYEGEGHDCIDLADDFLSVSSVSVYYPPTAAVATYTLAENTDYYLEPVSGPPYRRVELHGYGTISRFPYNARILATGTAGYASELLTVAATMGTVSASATTAVFTGAGVSVGATVRVDSEDLYITSTTAGTAFNTSGGTATVLRGQNGTTAAVHANGAAVAVHLYPRAVKDVTLRVAQRRWRSRDAGLTGDYGMEGVATTGNRDTERSILRSGLNHLRLYRAG
jgi:hypothetical protein